LGRLSYFVGFEFTTNKAGIVMHRQKYIGELLERFQIIDCNNASNPSETNAKLDECSNEEKVESTEFKQIVGSLRYLCNNRPDICFAVGIISRFMNDLRKSHLTAAKMILRYVKGTLKFGLLFPAANKEGEAELEGYFDSDWCGDKWIGKAPLATYSSSMVLQSHGAQRNNQSLLYLHVKLSTLLLHLQHVKQSGLTM
jgi:hypothetical protein